MTEEGGSESATDPRLALIRQSAVFQLKLLVDGLRDFVLVPVSLVATLAGLLRSATDPEREFEQVLQLGRRSERWINLFGTHDADGPGDDGSIDEVLERVEQVLREQARAGGITGGAREALDTTLAGLRRRSARKAVDGAAGRETGGDDQEGAGGSGPQ